MPICHFISIEYLHDSLRVLSLPAVFINFLILAVHWQAVKVGASYIVCQLEWLMCKYIVNWMCAQLYIKYAHNTNLANQEITIDDHPTLTPSAIRSYGLASQTSEWPPCATNMHVYPVYTIYVLYNMSHNTIYHLLHIINYSTDKQLYKMQDILHTVNMQ